MTPPFCLLLSPPDQQMASIALAVLGNTWLGDFTADQRLRSECTRWCHASRVSRCAVMARQTKGITEKLTNPVIWAAHLFCPKSFRLGRQAWGEPAKYKEMTVGKIPLFRLQSVLMPSTSAVRGGEDTSQGGS
jgi:hypothetical protein